MANNLLQPRKSNVLQSKAGPTVGQVYNNQDAIIASLGLSPLDAPRSTGPTLNPANWFAGEQPQGAVGGGGGGGGGGAAAAAGPTEAQLAPAMASLGSLDQVLANRNQASHDEYGRAVAGYKAQDALDSTNHDDSIAQNESSYTAGNQAGLLNAANAYGGLRGVLSSLGGLSGSGAGVIERLVGLAANADTGNARKNFETNATGISQNWATADQARKQRDADSVALRDNNLQNNQADVLNARQSIFKELANLFGAGTARGNEYSAKAAGLAGDIASTTRKSIAPYQAASSLYSPAALKQYLGGTQNLNVSTAGGPSGPAMNSPVFNSDKRKDQLNGVG